MKYEDWLTEDKLILLSGWVKEGLTNEQLVEKMGINRSTFYRWKDEFKDFKDILKRTKEVVDYEVENALFKRAMGQTIELEEQRLGRDGVIITLKKKMYIPPDTLALMYWLNNRKSSHWRNKQEIVNTNFEGFDTLAEKLKINEEEKE